MEKKTIEVLDEENSIVMDDEYSTTNFDIFPENKTFTVDMRIKDDAFSSHQIFEYKISVNPPELYIRLLESSSEPPKEYDVKDGVVLESEINKENVPIIGEDRIQGLKKQVEWNKVDLFEQSEINLFILSKHPEIISREDFRKFLRQSAERIKLGLNKVEESIKEGKQGLQIFMSDYGKYVWFSDRASEKEEIEEYSKLTDKKRDNSVYGKKLKQVEEFNKSLFSEDSSMYVGISEYEFKTGTEILVCIQKMLDKKDSMSINKEVKQEKMSTTKALVISLFLTLFISWIVSWFVDISPFLIFVLVQVVAFIQSIMGGWIEKWFE